MVQNLPFIDNRIPQREEYTEKSTVAYLCSDWISAQTALRQYSEDMPQKITDLIVMKSWAVYRLVMWVSSLSETNIAYLNSIRNRPNTQVVETVEYKNNWQIVARYGDCVLSIDEFIKQAEVELN